MSSLSHLFKIYSDIDSLLINEETHAQDANRRQEIYDMRQKNDLAYIVILYATFEGEITNNYVPNMLSKKRTTVWHDDIYISYVRRKLQNKRLNYLDRLSLVINKGSQKYRSLKDYYIIRNHIAHSGSTNEAIDVGDLYQLLENSLNEAINNINNC